VIAMSDDDALLRLFAEKRSENAFEQLVSRHLGLVYAAALRLLAGDTHRAEDVAQAVFIELAAQARRLMSHPSLTSWLYVTTRNTAVKWIRSEKRRKSRERTFEETRASDSGPEKALDWDRISPVLDQAICDLNAPEREALLLRFFQGHRFATIAAIQRVNEDSARMRVNRALQRLRQRLEGRGFISTASALSLALSDHSVRAAPEALRHVVTAAALAKGAAGTSALASFLMNTTKAKIAAGIVIAGLGLLFWERQLLQPLTRNVAELQDKTASLRRKLDAENGTQGLASIPVGSLTGKVAAAEAAEDDAVPLGPPITSTAQASASVLSDGRYSWGGKLITVSSLVANVAQFHRDHPETTAQILVNAQGCAGSQLAFLLAEARKNGVNVWLGPGSVAPVQLDPSEP